ncbi:DgyrCDS11711 [Dimorphilus gyrociliatus]|uniref:DgyrCDS11711 n=1 Tax=Dimorphilus gyrociliatus TaxID=2664684 RepID=A0A7I8W472_9ANNE|nr:DgyrCDS11711 [Dimorphilus gyrociliatus]
MSEKSPSIILYALLIEFDHSKGLIVEACYPPFKGEDNEENILDISSMPNEWTNLPNLAVPDGSHKVTEGTDTSYFILPGISETNHNSIYGVSCFSQIDVSKIINKLQKFTRNTVLKGVCVLSTKPLFGHIRLCLQPLTEAYFQELQIADENFSTTHWLKTIYNQVNMGLSGSSLNNASPFQELNCIQLVHNYKFFIIQLFKLLLIEKRVLFFSNIESNRLCSDILCILSLVPGILEEGLADAANYDKNKKTTIEEETDRRDEIVEIILKSSSESTESQENQIDSNIPNDKPKDDEICEISSDTFKESSQQVITDSEIFENTAKYSLSYVNSAIMSNWLENDKCPQLNDDQAAENLHFSKFGFPLKIFSENRLCFPYCSLHNLETLKSSTTKCYWAGATNQVFKMDTKHYDALVEIKNDKVELKFTNKELEKLTQPTSADKKFVDMILRITRENSSFQQFERDWQGSEDWLRHQFKMYLLSLAAVAVNNDASTMDDFNISFVKAWQLTNNFKIWQNHPRTILLHINPEHLNHGQSYFPEFVKGAKDKLSQTWKTSEVAGKLVQETTSKAISQVWSMVKNTASGSS